MENIPITIQPITSEFSDLEKPMVMESINGLLQQGAIVSCQPKTGQVISPFFLIEKPNGKKRFVLNLKRLNKFIKNDHFKMEDWRTVIKLMQKDCFMSSIDLKDAYFLIPIHTSSRKYLRFSFNNILYEFTCLPFGLSSAPYVFTKIIKPIVSYLHQQNICCTVYLDDFLILSDSQQYCKKYTTTVVKLLQDLGFLINLEKSSLIPQNRCKFLGFIFDSRTLTIELPSEKKLKIILAIKKLISLKSCKINFFAHVIGLLVSTLPTVKYGLLYIKNLEREKVKALIKTNQNYRMKMTINHLNIINDLKWWLQKIPNAMQKIKEDQFDLEIYTDSSKTGWGAYCGGEETHGWWNTEEKSMHINYLELLAIFYGLKCFITPNLGSCNVLLRVDNITALSYINRMGSIRHKHLNALAQMIWKWCEKKDIWIHACYVSTKENLADEGSRKISIETEWELCNSAFALIREEFGTPSIDLFASNINKKCPIYVSLHKDPFAISVDAFTISWKHDYFYAFPPFALILRVLKKIITDKAHGIMIVPYWPSQAWYTLFNRLLVGKPLILGPNNKLLSSPFRTAFPLPNLILVAGKLSGKHLN